MLGTASRQIGRMVVLPAALPGVVTGLRLGLSLGWMSVVVGELTGNSSGIGAMMNGAREAGRLDQIIIGMLAFALLGLGTDALLRRLSRRFIVWSKG